MSWKKILKIDRRLKDIAEDFAPKEMLQWRIEQEFSDREKEAEHWKQARIEANQLEVDHFKKYKWKKLREWIDQNKDAQDKDLADISTILNQATELPNDRQEHYQLWESAKKLMEKEGWWRDFHYKEYL